MRIWNAVAEAMANQRGHLFLWVPVFLAIGIGWFFTVKTEPELIHFVVLGVALFFCLLAGDQLGSVWGPTLWAIALICAGFNLAGLRAHLVAEPILTFRYYGPVEGRVIKIDRSATDAPRILLDHVTLEDVAPWKKPERVRVSLHGDAQQARLMPGQVIRLSAFLMPPSGPAEPGGFDFQRFAWFQRLGAVGYSRHPSEVLGSNSSGMWIAKTRAKYAKIIQTHLTGEAGAFAAAIMTGDRSGVGQETLIALRRSNLAHLLAISGLHMGLLAGLVLAACRLIISSLPWLALRVPVKKVSAGAALLAASGYLLLSGGSIATERAFIMLAVMLCAVIFERRAISLRAVALAAIIVLVIRPEALLSPGFQMSFSATTALVAVFGLLRDREWSLGPGILRPVLAVVLSSVVAGLATAPLGAAHFNQIARFGLLANLATVPLMGTIVMPAAIMATILLPFGGAAPAFWVMGLGLDWVLGVAHWVADRPDATLGVVTPPTAVLPTFAIGMISLLIWRGLLRFAGLALTTWALFLWAQCTRPPVLIADSGGLVGVMTAQGRGVSAEKGDGFVAKIWMENDGAPAEQAISAQYWPGSIRFGDGHYLHVAKGKRAFAATECAAGDWLVTNVMPQMAKPCHVLGPKTLRQTGALAVWPEGKEPRIQSARALTGQRLWNGGKYRAPIPDWPP